VSYNGVHSYSRATGLRQLVAPSVSPYTSAVAADGSVYIASRSGAGVLPFSRPEGNIWLDISGDVRGEATVIEFAADGSLLAAGKLAIGNGPARTRVMRFRDGIWSNLSSEFWLAGDPTGASTLIRRVAPLGSERVVVTGTFSGVVGGPALSYAAL